MLPQLAAAGLARGQWAGMSLQGTAGPASQQVYGNSLAVATAGGAAGPYASGLAGIPVGSALGLGRVGAAAAGGGGGVMAGAQGFLTPQDVGLSAINGQQAVINSWVSGWHHCCVLWLHAGLAPAKHGAACNAVATRSQ
jgi:hypothetical protein